MRSVLVNPEIQYAVLHSPYITFDIEKKDVAGYLYVPISQQLSQQDVARIFFPFASRYVITLDTIPFTLETNRKG